MKEMLLISIIVVVVAFGFYVMTRVDHFVSENQRLIDTGNRNGQSKIRIAAEDPAMISSVAAVLEQCSHTEPHISLFYSSGKMDRLMEKLQEEQIDMILMGDAYISKQDGRRAQLQLPGEKTDSPVTILTLPLKNSEEESRIHVVWKKDLKSKDRDRVIFALEQEYCSLKCGYADYLN